ncbi:hypothetical protein LUZ60_005785 [Juncus effusus]|nr:hypothetical protein LUZ60_005785 [Juncus effusus]
MAFFQASLSLRAFSLNSFQPTSQTNPFATDYSLTFQSKSRNSGLLSLRVEARNNTRTDSAKIRNRRLRKKFNGTPKKPRLSVFCSNKQLYAILADDQNKKILFYASTLQKSICDDPPCTIAEAAKKVGEELIKKCKEMKINEISCYDRNGLARGERIMAFEIPVSEFGFLK